MSCMLSGHLVNVQVRHRRGPLSDRGRRDASTICLAHCSNAADRYVWACSDNPLGNTPSVPTGRTRTSVEGSRSVLERSGARTAGLYPAVRCICASTELIPFSLSLPVQNSIDGGSTIRIGMVGGGVLSFWSTSSGEASIGSSVVQSRKMGALWSGSHSGEVRDSFAQL